MKLAEEVVADRFAPTWRGMLAKRLTERGMSQTEVALALGISQSAVSKHLQGKLAGDAALAAEPRLIATADRVARGLVEKTLSPFQALLAAEALVRELEDRGPICRLHEREMPELQGLNCDICVRVNATTIGAEQAALQDLKAALRILETVPHLVALVPHVGTNVARALPGVKDAAEVAAVPGRLFVMRGAVKVPAAPEFGVSRHMAQILVAVARAEPRLLACLNLTPDERLLAAARAAGLRVEKVAAQFERAPHALAFEGRVPDVFWHEGAFGIEPQAYLVDADATALATRVRALVAEAPPR